MHHPRVAVASAPDAEVLNGAPPPGLSWRHGATLALMLATLPLFTVAAVVVLPVLLAIGGFEVLRRLTALPDRPVRGTLRRLWRGTC